jgi:predicted phage-related endonuclease
MISDEQKKNRIGKVGSSDVCLICGLSPYGGKSPEKQLRDAYFRVLGLNPKSDNKSMSAGRYLEPAILNWAADHPKLDGRPFLRDHQLISTERDYCIASFDGLAGDYSFVVEAKWVENPDFIAHWGRAGNGKPENVPDYVQVQMQHQMYVAGNTCQIGYAAVLRGIGGFGLYSLKRDDELIEQMLYRIDAFYQNHIIPRIAPVVPGETEAA